VKEGGGNGEIERVMKDGRGVLSPHEGGRWWWSPATSRRQKEVAGSRGASCWEPIGNSQGGAMLSGEGERDGKGGLCGWNKIIRE
jgi:hypothetical protein